MNVIFHIDQSAQWPLLIANVHNYRHWLQEQGEAATIEVLINGPAVLDAKLGSDIDLAPLIVDSLIAVCANSLRGHDLTASDLQPGLVVVPSGVIELAQRQHNGFAYIKP